MKKILHFACTGALAMTLVGCSSSTRHYTAGTYTASAMGFGGNVEAAVTVDGSKITEVVLTGDQETENVGKAALGTLTEQVIKAQSAEIDGVSGATVTSNAVKQAVEKALALAKGETAAVS